MEKKPPVKLARSGCIECGTALEEIPERLIVDGVMELNF